MVTQIKKRFFSKLVISVNAILYPFFFIFFLFPQSFEALSERAVAVVVDPIQSVKGKVRVFRFTLWKTVQTLVKKNLGWAAFLDNSYLWHCDKLHVRVLYSCETCICPGKRHLPNNTGTALKRVFAQENAIYPAILVLVFIFVFVFFFDRRLL